MKEGALCCVCEMSLSVVRFREEMPERGAGLLPKGRGVEEIDIELQ